MGLTREFGDSRAQRNSVSAHQPLRDKNQQAMATQHVSEQPGPGRRAAERGFRVRLRLL